MSVATKFIKSDELKIDIDAVKMGMFIADLDIPWIDTKFPFAGFLLKTDNELNELKRCCKWVVVSKNKSSEGMFNLQLKRNAEQEMNSLHSTEEKTSNILAPIGDMIVAIQQEVNSFLEFFSLPRKVRESYNPKKIYKNKNQSIKEDMAKIRSAKGIRQAFKKDDDLVSDSMVNYVATKTIHDEAKVAKIVKNELLDATSLALSADMNSSDIHSSIDLAKDAISDVVESVSRNPDAMQLVSKIKSMDANSYHHAIEVSLLMVALGRELCFPKLDMIEIGLGGLLHDVGEIKPKDNGSPKIKNITKFKLYKEHIAEGLKIAEKAKYSSIVKQIIGRHHEHYDGSGYPSGRKEGQIGLYGNMAIIVDSYVSLTTGRCCDTPVMPNRALDIMFKQKGKLFHPEILDKFIQVIGIYPVGTKVKLSSGDIGFVIKQNRGWRLRPIVMVVMNKKGRKLDNPIHIDLMDEDINKKPLSIVAELPVDSFNVNAEDYF